MNIRLVMFLSQNSIFKDYKYRIGTPGARQQCDELHSNKRLMSHIGIRYAERCWRQRRTSPRRARGRRRGTASGPGPAGAAAVFSTAPLGPFPHPTALRNAIPFRALLRFAPHGTKCAMSLRSAPRSTAPLRPFARAKRRPAFIAGPRSSFTVAASIAGLRSSPANGRAGNWPALVAADLCLSPARRHRSALPSLALIAVPP
jgi:hypothetical protein